MIKVTCWIRPHRLEPVKAAIAALNVNGMSVSDVRGCGVAPETTSFFGGEEHVIALPLRAKVEVVAPDALKDAIIEAVLKHARTGEPGDGKIIVERVQDAIRIRTGERGEAAI